MVQYSSLCRFSDLAVVNLDDIVSQLDYFKICIQYYKTDQKGEGQCCQIAVYTTILRKSSGKLSLIAVTF
jgi:hypothetical protein